MKERSRDFEKLMKEFQEGRLLGYQSETIWREIQPWLAKKWKQIPQTFDRIGDIAMEFPERTITKWGYYHAGEQPMVQLEITVEQDIRELTWWSDGGMLVNEVPDEKGTAKSVWIDREGKVMWGKLNRRSGKWVD